MAYNTTPFHGKACRVEKGDTATEYTEGWSIDVSLDMDDISRQGQNWKEGIPGLAGWSGQFSAQAVMGNTEQKAFLDNLITATPGTKLTDVKFLLDGSTNAYTGDLYITNYSIGTNVSGKVVHTFNFQGNGALTITDSA